MSHILLGWILSIFDKHEYVTYWRTVVSWKNDHIFDLQVKYIYFVWNNICCFAINKYVNVLLFLLVIVFFKLVF